MRFLLDEHFSAAIADGLRRLGIDAVAIQRDRPELLGQTDDVVLRAATVERRVLVTNNVRDFVALVEDFAIRGETQVGVLFTSDARFPRTHAGIGSLVHALAAYVADSEDDPLLDGCAFLPGR